MSSTVFNEIPVNLNAAHLRIGIVMSRFNPDVGAGLRTACIDELQRLGVHPDHITLATVPGALELPLALQAMAQKQNADGSAYYHALVAIGSVIRGETYHFEVVSNESARGLLDVQLKTGIPIANAVLTTENDDQALVRMQIKGTEAAQAAVEMARLCQVVR